MVERSVQQKKECKLIVIPKEGFNHFVVWNVAASSRRCNWKGKLLVWICMSNSASQRRPRSQEKSCLSSHSIPMILTIPVSTWVSPFNYIFLRSAVEWCLNYKHFGDLRLQIYILFVYTFSRSHVSFIWKSLTHLEDESYVLVVSYVDVDKKKGLHTSLCRKLVAHITTLSIAL